MGISEKFGDHCFNCYTTVDIRVKVYVRIILGHTPLSTVHSNSLLYLMLFCETHDLVWEIISISEKRIKNCIVKIINNVFEKMTKVGYFL